MKDFIPYVESLALKELGFDEPCIKYYWADGMFTKTYESPFNHNKRDNLISAPLYRQAFRFFREKYNLEGWVTPLVDEQGFVFKYQSRFHRAGFSVEVVGDYDSSEEAELECLRRLIAVVS
jgi:hypothetical protein